MILADTSVWIDHLRNGIADLEALLENQSILCHPFVIGELACGNLRNRVEILALLRRLPALPVLSDAEVFAMVEARRLMGRGIGWVDVHLIGSALLERAQIWTYDVALARAAERLGIAAPA